MKTLKFEFVGVAPLLMHNSRLADPRNRYTQKIKSLTAKGKKKTEEDLDLIIQYEFLGGMYLRQDNGPDGETHKDPYIPSEWVEGAVRDGAKARKKGKDIQRGMLLTETGFLLKYKGSNDARVLYQSEDFCFTVPSKVGQARVMRTRCRFLEWSFVATLIIDEEVLDTQDILEAVNRAGSFVGIGDWRPKYGRFAAKLLNGK